MNEAVDRLIAEREHLDAGLSTPVVVSLGAHVLLAAVAILAPLLMPRGPVLQVADGFAVELPRGGGGVPQAPAPPPAAQPKPPEPAPAAPPRVLKPPTEAPKPNALPEPESRRRAPRREPAPAAVATPEPRATPATGSGTAAATPGLEFGPPGPGVPTGTATGGDWYLAGVQQKIWVQWNQQVRDNTHPPVGVTFTILANGSVTDVHVSRTSGAALLDMAAQRAILNAAPFGPLPREYEAKQITKEAIFKSAS